MTEAAMDSDDGNPDQKQTKKLVSGTIIVPLPNGSCVEAIARKKDYLLRIIRLYDSSSRLNFNSGAAAFTWRGPMLFDHCAECQRCCIVETGYPPLEVTLTETEVSRIGSVCIESSCKHLGPSGCTMGDTKPFACTLYPLSFNPHSRRFMFDGECPIMPTYVEQLHDRNSDASRHLSAIKKQVLKLEKADPDFLARNYDVDIDYFELIELPLKSTLRGYGK